MCGIVGYLGKKNAKPILIEGLKNLEYRGYDSSGVAVFSGGKIKSVKAVGRILELEKNIENIELSGRAGIAHTRWATHGEATIINAHPHNDCYKKIWLVHNGIVENYKEQRNRLLKQGHVFNSETDTEVIAHLIEEFYIDDLRQAIIKMLSYIKGAYAILVIHEDEPDKIVAARLSSPLVLGINDNETYIASDQLALTGKAKRIVYLDDYELVEITQRGYNIFNFKNQPVNKKIYQLGQNTYKISKSIYSHFMLKEIFEQSEAITNSLRGRIEYKSKKVILGGLVQILKELKQIEKIIIIACGTAFYAGMVGRYLYKKLLPITIEVELASEFRYSDNNINEKTLIVAISQSGETADTLKGIKLAKENGAITLGIVNVVGSTIAREVDAGIYNHIGPEIAVASTKAFVSQISILVLLCLYLNQLHNTNNIYTKRILTELTKIPDLIKNIFDMSEHIKKIAEKYINIENFAFIGRKYNYPIALEGALKLKEISYIHAEGWPSGELKHGSIALIGENFPTIAIVTKDSVYDKNISNIEEIKSRKGRVIAIASEKDNRILSLADDTIFIPETLEELTPLLSVIPLQLFAYHMAVLRGCDVDRPRNLAKSVTVE